VFHPSPMATRVLRALSPFVKREGVSRFEAAALRRAENFAGMTILFSAQRMGMLLAAVLAATDGGQLRRPWPCRARCCAREGRISPDVQHLVMGRESE